MNSFLAYMGGIAISKEDHHEDTGSQLLLRSICRRGLAVVSEGRIGSGNYQRHQYRSGNFI